MVAVLEDMQFDLDGFVFGNHLPVFIDAAGFDPGESVEILQDGTNPITGARVWGRDMRGAKTWTFSCHLDRTNTVEALESLAAMGSKWQDEKWLEPETVAMLRYHLGGRTRVVFGKPRKFSHAISNNVMQGHVPPVASFDLSDSKHYDDDEGVLDLQVAPSTPGGFTVPFDAPLIIELPADAVRQGAFDVGGDTTTNPVIEFTGPLTNGVVTIDDEVTVGFVGTLGIGQKIVIDARPWSMGVTRSGGANVALTRTTRLARSKLSPGGHEAVLRGTDATGTGRARVRWRNAYTTL